jgi:regulator of protease activity HflC (stomatin/prohibitin superfamily)
MSIQGYITYKCINPFLMVYAVRNIENVIRDIAGGLLKRLVNKNDFNTILLRKKELSEDLRVKLEKAMHPGGVLIPFLDITQIMMSQQMQESMSQAAITKKEAQSKQITAKAEIKSSNLLKKAGEIMN